MRARSCLLAAALLGPTFAGCGHDAINGGDDTAVDMAKHAQPDLAARPDLVAPADLAVPHSGIGDPCKGPGGLGNPGDCPDPASQMCVPDGQFGFAGGYCTQQCDPNNPCPADAKCVAVGGNFSLCFLKCMSDADCRQTMSACAGLDYICSPRSQTCQPRNPGGGGNTVGVTPGTNNCQACVQPVVKPGAGLAGPFGVNTDVTPGQGIDAECWLSVEPKSKHIVVGYNDLTHNGPMGTVFSADDGVTWSKNEAFIPPNKMVDPSALASDPVTAVDPMGNFWISWVGYDLKGGPNPTNMRVYVARSKNGGMSFDDVFPVSPMGEGQQGGLDKPWIAVSPIDGSMYVTYDRQNANAVDIRMARSADQGMTWTVTTISDTNSRPMLDRNLCQITFGQDGKPYAAWVEIGQAQFGSTANRVYTQRFNVDGTRNGLNVLASRAPDSPAFEDPSIAVVDANVYVGFISGTSKGDWDVKLAYSLDGGATWQPSVKVNDDPTCATHFHHQIAVDGKGNIHAIWYDNRFLDGNLFYAWSPPADAMHKPMFGQNVFVNDAPFAFTTRRDMSNWLGDYVGLDVVGGEIYAAWSDNRGTNRSHIFFAKGTLPK